jgi:uncharacterized protein (TIGR02996 family)
MPSIRITDRERSLLEAIHSAPQEDKHFLAYAEWLTNRNNPLGEFIRMSCADMKVGKPCKQSRLLAERHGDEWVISLPENACFDGHYFKGLPVIRMVVHARTPASPLALMDIWSDGVSPRQFLNLCVDLRPSGLWKGTREKCWIELPKVFRHPLMRQVHTLSVAFDRLCSEESLSLGGRRGVIRDIGREVDPGRTPFVVLHGASTRTRQRAERELIAFPGLRFVN